MHKEGDFSLWEEGEASSLLYLELKRDRSKCWWTARETKKGKGRAMRVRGDGNGSP